MASLASVRVAGLRWAGFDGLPFDALVTTRHGGLSSGVYDSLNLSLGVGDDPALVVENRRRAAAAIGLDLDHMVYAHQVHGHDVAVVTTADRGRGSRSTEDAPAADAL